MTAKLTITDTIKTPATMALTVDLYIRTPKGYFPQDDTGLIFGGTRASPEISFEAMKELQQRVTEMVRDARDSTDHHGHGFLVHASRGPRGAETRPTAARLREAARAARQAAPSLNCHSETGASSSSATARASHARRSFNRAHFGCAQSS